MKDSERENPCSRSDDTPRRFPVRRSELDRFKLGKKYYYQVQGLDGKTLFCLDVACGAKPFPKADVLCDLNVEAVPDRRMMRLETEGKPFIKCDCRFLPFKDRAFDFVTSYYTVEHVDDPQRLFGELKRVAKHGYIQCPSWLNEVMYGEDVHKWTVIRHGDKLFLKPIDQGAFRLRFGFVFHRLYRLNRWRVFHAILDESFRLFTVSYSF
jgi:SAM-dependent methyltransferase